MTITSPVSRSIGVSDVVETVAFYCDVLGFRAVPPRDGRDAAVSAVELGAARLQLERRGEAHAVLFFEVDDVRALQGAITARGGAPSAIAPVNWIKMDVLEIRDPDGHTLWFGQSFHQPHPPADSQGQLKQIMPNFPFDDVRAGLVHYRDVLGFTVNYAQDDLAVMDRDEVRVILIKRSPRYRGIGSCYVYVRNADALHAELTAKGANVRSTPVSQPWGLREFEVVDIDGNQLWFGQPFE